MELRKLGIRKLKFNFMYKDSPIDMIRTPITLHTLL